MSARRQGTKNAGLRERETALAAQNTKLREKNDRQAVRIQNHYDRETALAAALAAPLEILDEMIEDCGLHTSGYYRAALIVARKRVETAVGAARSLINPI